MPGGIADLDLVFPSARIHCEPDAWRGLERVRRQGLQGQGRAGFPQGGRHRLDQPLFEDAHTPETTIGKPAPGCPQGTDVTRERHRLQEIA